MDDAAGFWWSRAPRFLTSSSRHLPLEEILDRGMTPAVKAPPLLTYASSRVDALLLCRPGAPTIRLDLAIAPGRGQRPRATMVRTHRADPDGLQSRRSAPHPSRNGRPWVETRRRRSRWVSPPREEPAWPSGVEGVRSKNLENSTARAGSVNRAGFENRGFFLAWLSAWRSIARLCGPGAPADRAQATWDPLVGESQPRRREGRFLSRDVA